MKKIRMHSIGAMIIAVLFIVHIDKNDRKDQESGIEKITTESTAIETSNPAVNDAQPLAIVRRFRPLVRVREAENPQWVEASMAKELFDRDTLRTDAEGYAVIQLVDNSLARVRPNSMLIIRGEVNNRAGLNTTFELESGSMNLDVAGRQSEYEVRTPSATASVKGTRLQIFIGEDGSSIIVCFSGLVSVIASNSGRQVELNRRRQARVDPEGNTIEVKTLTRREIRQLENEENQAEQTATPKRIIIQLRNADGEIRNIEIPYFESSGN
jgi:hypothetical protein